MAPEKGGTSSNGNGRTLHNFSLPPRLSWGTQKLLRCSTSASSLTDTVSRSRSPPTKRHRINHRDDGDKIDAVRENLMLDLGTAFGNGPSVMPAAVEVAPGTEVRTWNLRTRRAALSASPVRHEVSPVVAVAEEREEGDVAVVRRVKFSVPLSRQEVEDDFVAMLGRRPPRKPKKRPRYIQKELETIFPGVWLSEITADMYKVNEEVPEAPK